MRAFSYSQRRTATAVLLWAGVAFAVIIAIFVGASYLKHTTTTLVVTGKERVCSGSHGNGGSSCKYLIYTDDTTYRVSDSIAAGRFNSSDFYGRIHVCHRYEITYYGIRFGLTSSYPNITKAVDLGKAEGCEP